MPTIPSPRFSCSLFGFFLALVTTGAIAHAQQNNASQATPANTTVISGFGDGSQFTTTAVNAPTAITNSVLTLTTATNSVAASAFYNTRVNIGAFTASFTFTSSNPSTPGYGFTFIAQNDPRGPSALGSAGGDLGYSGISNGAGFGLNLYPWYPRGTFVVRDGTVPYGYYATYDQFNYAYFSSGIPYTVTLTYANSLLLATITGADLASPYQSSYAVNLPSLVGDTLAYVGFTGGTGDAVTGLTITDFTFTTPVPEPATWALLGPGLGLLGWAHQRRRLRRTRLFSTP
jgi:hypothetical protein